MKTHGWILNENFERLTNIRYADDVILFARSLDELQYMLTTLLEIFGCARLEAHDKKTKFLCTFDAGYNFVVARNLMLEILNKLDKHRYFGRTLNTYCQNRCNSEIQNRISNAWIGCKKNQETFINRHVNLCAKLKLFHNTVLPRLLFGLTTMPLAKQHMAKLNVIIRKMIRRIIGWTRKPNESWQKTMRCMKKKYQKAMQIYMIPDCEILLEKQRTMLWRHLLHPSQSSWPKLILHWDPREFEEEFANELRRRCGRPNARWDDVYQHTCDQYFRNTKRFELDIDEIDVVFGTS